MTSNAPRVPVKDIITATGLPRRRVKVIIALLEGAGIVYRTGRGVRNLKEFDSPEQLDLFLNTYEKRHLSDSERLATMMRYGQTSEFRMLFLRQYFGEQAQLDCGICDNCPGPATW